MATRRCPKIRGLLGPYADGELGALRRRGVERHVASCAACRRELAVLERTRGLVREAVQAAARGTGGDEAEAVLAALRPRLAAAAPPRPRHLGRLLASAAAAAAVAALAVFAVYKPRPPVVREGTWGNQCIVDRVEGEAGTILVFRTHGSSITVIWVSGGPAAGGPGAEPSWT